MLVGISAEEQAALARAESNSRVQYFLMRDAGRFSPADTIAAAAKLQAGRLVKTDAIIERLKSAK